MGGEIEVDCIIWKQRAVLPAPRSPVAAYHRREAAQERKRPGRPAHRHKGEALDIAAAFRESVPQASLYRVVQVVAGELAHQYTDPPSACSGQVILTTV